MSHLQVLRTIIMLLKILVCFSFSVVLANNYDEHYETTVKKLLDKINSDYNPQILPRNNGTVVVTVYVFVRRLEKLDDVNREYSMELTLRQKWKDQRLSIQHPFPFITINDNSKLWVPDTFFSNEKHGHVHNIITPNLYFRIFPDGTVLYNARVSLKVFCQMNFKNFPMDRQICSVRIGSYGYTTDHLVYLWKEGYYRVEVVRGLQLPRFELEGLDADYCSSKSIAPAEVSCLQIEFFFKRRFTPYFFQIYLPCGILVFISWLPFWINKEAVFEKTFIGIILLLFMLFFIQNINGSFPAVSYIKAVDVWLYGCLAFILMSLLAVVYTTQLSRKRTAACKNSLQVENLLIATDSDTSLKTESYDVKEPRQCVVRLQKVFSRDPCFFPKILFPIAFVVFIFAHYAMIGTDFDYLHPTLKYNN